MRDPLGMAGQTCERGRRLLVGAARERDEAGGGQGLGVTLASPCLLTPTSARLDAGSGHGSAALAKLFELGVFWLARLHYRWFSRIERG